MAFGLKLAKPIAVARSRHRVADGEIDPQPHDLMWVDNDGEARHISDNVMRTVTLTKILLFQEWVDRTERVGAFVAPQLRSGQ